MWVGGHVTAPLILTLDTRWRFLKSRRQRPRYPVQLYLG